MSISVQQFREGLKGKQPETLDSILEQHPEVSEQELVARYEDRVTERGGMFQIFQAIYDWSLRGATQGQEFRLGNWVRIFDAAKQPYPVTNEQLGEAFGDKRAMSRVIKAFEKVGAVRKLTYHTFPDEDDEEDFGVDFSADAADEDEPFDAAPPKATASARKAK